MAPTLYTISVSPCVQSVQITATALGIQLEEKEVNILKNEQLTPEYIKINPQHTVPTLVEEDGFTLWDSHAINAYLVSKYGKDDSLYPTDLKKRATVDQRLHFNNGVAFVTLLKILNPVFYTGKTSLDKEDEEDANAVYAFLETFLDGKPWIGGDSKTIADYHLYANISALDIAVPVDCQKFSKVVAWLEKVGALPEAEVTKKGIEDLKKLIASKLQK